MCKNVHWVCERTIRSISESVKESICIHRTAAEKHSVSHIHCITNYAETSGDSRQPLSLFPAGKKYAKGGKQKNCSSGFHIPFYFSKNNKDPHTLKVIPQPLSFTFCVLRALSGSKCIK
jgi:hypothetical protein